VWLEKGNAMPYWRLHYHLVWATKDRRPTIGDTEEEAIRRSFHLTVHDLLLIPHAIGIMPDHVHVAVSIPPKIAVSEAVKRLKGASANAVNHRTGEDRIEPFVWQRDYEALSFGDDALPRVVDYVNHQPQRHAMGRTWAKLEQANDGHGGRSGIIADHDETRE
jgi:putative transposase